MKILLLLSFIIWVWIQWGERIRAFVRRLTFFISRPGVKQVPEIFDHHYLDGKLFYIYRFKTVPSISFVGEIEISRAFSYLETFYGSQVKEIFQACYFNRELGKQEFSKTLFVMKNRMVVELAGEYARVCYSASFFRQADELITALSAFKVPEKEKEYEINVITLTRDGLELKRLDIKPTQLDIGLYYNDDFREVDELIRTRLARPNDKGIVLLHGLPGTGKTTYLRHLVGTLDKKVLFVSPTVAGNLMNPEFIDLLIDNPNAVLIIEDAEDIIMDRKQSRDSSVSNLLNISDGLLSDCLSVQIICTFNSSLSLIDSALLRKGRLIAKYEFGKLSTEKARKLSAHLGFSKPIEEPMTIAEIANPNDPETPRSAREPIGFRIGETLMN